MVGRNSPTDAHTVAHFDTGTKATVVNSVFTSVAGSKAGCLDIADADTASVNPVFNSVFMSCGISYRPNNATRSETVFKAGTNNTANGTSTLTAPTAGVTIANQSLTFINGANEAAVTPFKASSVHAAFVDTDYIGAVKNASDTW